MSERRLLLVVEAPHPGGVGGGQQLFPVDHAAADFGRVLLQLEIGLGRRLDVLDVHLGEAARMRLQQGERIVASGRDPADVHLEGDQAGIRALQQDLHAVGVAALSQRGELEIVVVIAADDAGLLQHGGLLVEEVGVPLPVVGGHLHAGLRAGRYPGDRGCRRSA
jgi:hypothetical protein